MPALDSLLVPLGSPLHWLLLAPATDLQDTTHLGRIIGDSELVSDQGGDSGLGPHLPLEAPGLGSLGQKLQQLAPLFQGEARCCPRGWPVAQALLALLLGLVSATG
jgi:hypothetical protein